MPTDSLIVAVCVVAMFVVFAAVLFWGDLQTRPKQLADRPHASAAPSDRAEPSVGRDHLQESAANQLQSLTNPSRLIHVNRPDACLRFGCACSREVSL